MSGREIQVNYAGNVRRSGEWLSGRRCTDATKQTPGARALVMRRDDLTCQRVIREIRDSEGRLLDVEVCGMRPVQMYMTWLAERPDTKAPLHAGHIAPFEANAANGLNHDFLVGQDGTTVEVDNLAQTREDLASVGFSAEYIAWVMGPGYEPAYDVDCLQCECWQCNIGNGARRPAKDVALFQMARARKLNDAMGIGRWFNRPNQRAPRVPRSK